MLDVCANHRVSFIVTFSACGQPFLNACIHVWGWPIYRQGDAFKMCVLCVLFIAHKDWILSGHGVAKIQAKGCFFLA
eukprot:1146685-Pelagomonas_calceolata.AAC.3